MASFESLQGAASDRAGNVAEKTAEHQTPRLRACSAFIFNSAQTDPELLVSTWRLCRSSHPKGKQKQAELCIRSNLEWFGSQGTWRMGDVCSSQLGPLVKAE
jgi:hypothetical protein